MLEFYNSIGIEKVFVQEYISKLKKKIKDKGLIEKLNILSRKNFKIFVTTLHGDLAKENILKKEGKIIFVDWNPYKGVITDDLINLIGKKISKKMFEFILEFYPKEVKEAGAVNFEIQTVEIKTKPDDAKDLFEKAIRFLKEPLPKINSDCEYCSWLEKANQAKESLAQEEFKW